MAELSIQKEIEVVSRIVRGEPYRTISEDLGVSMNAISAVKKRQSSAIQALTNKLLERKQVVAQRILDKTQNLLEDRVDNALKYEEKCRELEVEYEAELAETWDFEDQKVAADKRQELRAKFGRDMTKLKESNMTTQTAIALSREMNTQASEEAPQGPQSTQDSQAQLVALVEAIKAGDEVKLQQIILNPKND